jgi:carbonic anhydrase
LVGLLALALPALAEEPAVPGAPVAAAGAPVYEPTAEPAPAPAAPVAAPESDALARLREGSERFAAGRAAHPRADAARLAETATGQHPFATVLACSDSRVPVELLFDQGVGDVFVVRVAGNVADTDEIASLEYGVDHLATPVLVVLGHERCGAVTATVEGAETHGSIPELLAKIRPAVAQTRRMHPGTEPAALVPLAIRTNVFLAIETLLRRSEAVRKRVAAGELQVVGAIYDLSTGRVEWLGEHRDQALLLDASRGGRRAGAAPGGPGRPH